MFDQGIVLAVARPGSKTANLWDNAWFWIKPFKWDAYLMVLVFWLFPATLVMVLEKMGNYDFGGKANMTAFLVVAHGHEPTVNNVDEFISQGLVACLPQTWGVLEPIKARWPLLKFVEKDAKELAMHVVQGTVCH
eukprot:gene56979-biopygen38657